MKRETSPRDGSQRAWVAAVGISGASPTLSVTTGTSASTNTGRQKAPDQVMRLQDRFELQP